MFDHCSRLLPGVLILSGEFILVRHRTGHGSVLFLATGFHLQTNDLGGGGMRLGTFKLATGQQCFSYTTQANK